MSGAMSPPSVEAVEDRDVRGKPSSMLVDNGVTATTDGTTKHRSSLSSMEERSTTPAAVVHSPSVSGVSAPNYLKDQIIAFFQVSDNKLAMKLFGNKNALMREKMRQRAVGNWVIHPCSNFRQVFHSFQLTAISLDLSL